MEEQNISKYLKKYKKLYPYKVYVLDLDYKVEGAIYANELYYKNEEDEVKSVQTNKSILNEFDSWDLPKIPKTNKILKNIKSDDLIYFLQDCNMNMIYYPKDSKESDLYFCIIQQYGEKNIMNTYNLLICKYYDNSFHIYNRERKTWLKFDTLIPLAWSKLNV